MEMRFRVANETRRDLAHKGDIINVNFKLILMRAEVICPRRQIYSSFVSNDDMLVDTLLGLT